VIARDILREVRNATGNTFYKASGSSRRLHSSREEVLEILPKESVGAELGVYRGEFSKHILRIVKPRELHLVDVWWLEYGEHYPNWGAYSDFGRLSTKGAYEEAIGIVEEHGRGRNIVVHVGYDLEYLEGLPDSHLDWAYVDTSHQYEHSKLELEILRKKVKRGGLIAGDDWHEDPTHIHYGLARAVKQFCAENKWEIVLLSNWGQWVIQQGN
jgi:hypothetical protein